MIYDMIIVGAGTAGLTAGIYALRAGKRIVILECEAIGGQITTSPRVENYPGISSISGMDFADGLTAQLTQLGGEVTYGKVTRAEKTDSGYAVATEGGERYEAEKLVIASGAAHRHLGLDREDELAGKGLSYCAVCDGAFFRSKTTAVVGGGSAALQDALYLAGICDRVYLIHRRDSFRAEKKLVERVKNEPAITCLMESRVTALLGENRVSGITVTSTADNSSRDVELDGLFIAVGMEPHNEVFAELVKLDANGYIEAGEDCRTSAPGIYAAGDCRTKNVRQLTTAAADGTVCGLA